MLACSTYPQCRSASRESLVLSANLMNHLTTGPSPNHHLPGHGSAHAPGGQKRRKPTTHHSCSFTEYKQLQRTSREQPPQTHPAIAQTGTKKNMWFRCQRIVCSIACTNFCHKSFNECTAALQKVLECLWVPYSRCTLPTLGVDAIRSAQKMRLLRQRCQCVKGLTYVNALRPVLLEQPL